MDKHIFSVKLIKENNEVRSEYAGDSAIEAYNCYKGYFCTLLNVEGMKTIATAIDNVPVTQYFDLILEDMYL